ncbi:MAG: DUF58 domain-containing protein [Phycisphaera sp.]|nr:DUF58 domain-containing protein [Phycisphaera sp.]
MPTTTDYLDPRTLASISPLELRARFIVEGLMTGMHRSPYQGYSVEFAQHRQYAPGDDIRHLDWKVFARTDKLYLKQYQKETNLDLVLLVDVSGSMAYGGGPSRRVPTPGKTEGGRSERDNARERGWRKFDHAASVAAALAYLAIQQQDRVGLVTFDDHIRSTVKASNSRGQWRTVVEHLGVEPLDPAAVGDTGFAERKTDLSKLLDQVNAKLSQRSLIVLVSDLFDDPASLDRGLARLSHRRHDVIVMQVLDHDELEFPFRGPSQFVGLEAEGKVNLDPSALRKAYLESLQAHLREVERIAQRYRFDYLLLDSSQSLGPPLSHFLARRGAMTTATA